MLVVLGAVFAAGVFLTVVGLGMAANDWAARRSRMARRMRMYVDPTDYVIIGMPTHVELREVPKGSPSLVPHG